MEYRMKNGKTVGVTCHTCGTHLLDREVIVDLRSNEVTTAKGTAKLTPIMAEIVYALHKADVLPPDRVLFAVYGNSERHGSTKTLRVHIKDARIRIQPLGLDIRFTNERGYWLETVREGAPEEKVPPIKAKPKRVRIRNRGAVKAKVPTAQMEQQRLHELAPEWIAAPVTEAVPPAKPKRVRIRKRGVSKAKSVPQTEPEEEQRI